jgi:hypothetical protein
MDGNETLWHIQVKCVFLYIDELDPVFRTLSHSRTHSHTPTLSQGARIRTDVPLPTFNTFVLTTASGVQTYGSCVTFYERLVHDKAFRTSRRAAAATAAIAYRQVWQLGSLIHKINCLNTFWKLTC